jgi:hypothetical protein
VVAVAAEAGAVACVSALNAVADSAWAPQKGTLMASSRAIGVAFTLSIHLRAEAAA